MDPGYPGRVYLYENQPSKTSILNYYLAQISLRRGAGEHVLHCDGSLEGLVITRV